jgi:flagellar biogenesis protein FliO
MHKPSSLHNNSFHHAPRVSTRTIGIAMVACLIAYVMVMVLAGTASAQTGPIAPSAGDATGLQAGGAPSSMVGTSVAKPAAVGAVPTDAPGPLFPAEFRPTSSGAAARAAATSDDSGQSAAVGGGGWGEVGSMLVPLSIVLGVILLATAIFKRVMRAGGHLGSSTRAPAGILEMLGRYPVGRGQNLLLVKLDQRILLIGQTNGSTGRGGSGGGLSTLAELTEPEDVASILMKVSESEESGPAGKFNRLLQQQGSAEGRGGLSGVRSITQRMFGRQDAVVWDERLLKDEAASTSAVAVQSGDAMLRDRLDRLRRAASGGPSASVGGAA